MGYYKVLLRCELPKPLIIDGDTIGGFYTTRFVDASFDVAAGELAIEGSETRRSSTTCALSCQGSP
jgi:hypothetical protein